MFDSIKEKFFQKSAEALRQQEDIEYVRDAVLRKFPLLGVTMARLKTVAAEKVGGTVVGTAGTDGKTIYYSPTYFDTLSDDEKVFVYAHEVMHVAFNHVLRSGNRNHRLWNQATDAVINQMLMAENLPMAEGGVDIAEAIHHSAEEMYEKLLQEKEEKQKQKEQNKKDKDDQKNQDESGSGDGDSDEDENEQAGHDNHEIWKEAVKQHEREEQQKQEKDQKSRPTQKQQQSKRTDAPSDQDKQKSDADKHKPDGNQNQDQSDVKGGDGSDDRGFDNWLPANESEYEKGFEQQNHKTKAQMAEVAQQQLNIEKNRAMEAQIADSVRTFGDVGKSNAAMDWERVLKKALETEQDKWSYRRSDADNDYMARVEEIDDEDKAETEVIMDTSGSVSDEFLREFLRQLKPLLKNSKLRVACFDHRFHPFIEIKTDKDIDKYPIPDKGNTNWDLAVKSFTRKKHINKIIFTDGETPGKMPDASTKNINVIWLVYGNEEFNPICGRVIRVAPRQVEQNFLRVPPQLAAAQQITKRR